MTKIFHAILNDLEASSSGTLAREQACHSGWRTGVSTKLYLYNIINALYRATTLAPLPCPNISATTPSTIKQGPSRSKSRSSPPPSAHTSRKISEATDGWNLPCAWSRITQAHAPTARSKSSGRVVRTRDRLLHEMQSASASDRNGTSDSHVVSSSMQWNDWTARCGAEVMIVCDEVISQALGQTRRAQSVGCRRWCQRLTQQRAVVCLPQRLGLEADGW